METLLAIAEHDDAEVELDDENLLTPTGGPLTFSMKTFDEKHCDRLAMLTITKSRYIALLTSLHMEFLCRKEAKTNKEVHKFLQVQKKLQASFQKELHIPKKELEKIYSLLEWCDACSLILCQQQIPPELRALEISTGPDHKTYQLFQLSDQTLTIDPWPFEPKAFSVQFETRTINQLKFENPDTFRNAFVNAPVKETVWNIRKKPPGNKV